MSQSKGLRPIPARPIQPRNARPVSASSAARPVQANDDDEELDLAVLAESMLPDDLGRSYGERPDRFWLWTTLAAAVAVGGAFWTLSTLMAGAPTQSANSMLQPVASASVSAAALGPSARPGKNQSSLLIVEYGGMPTPTPTPESTTPPEPAQLILPPPVAATPPPLETLPAPAPTSPIQLNRPVGSGNNAMLAPPALGNPPKLPPPALAPGTPPGGNLQPTAAAPTQYQVTAGPYTSADEAQAAAQELSQRGHKVAVYPDKDRHRLRIGAAFPQQEDALVLAEEVSLLGFQVVVRRSE